MTRPRRSHAEARAQMREGILRLGNAQLAEVGAAALSVREIARGLGVASSAIYRHVASRDELLTLLIVDAYEDLAEAALIGLQRGDEADTSGNSAAVKFAGLVREVRRWALANPARWALAYGSPVPGYVAPAQQTTDAGTRVLAAFVTLLTAGERSAASAAQAVSAGFAADLADGARDLGVVLDDSPVALETAAAAVEAWTGLIGIVSAEVFEQLGAEFSAHGEEMLERWIAGATARFGLT